MPKAEKGTPKYLANKMKAKGLQKLRWYCQMCEKQCRDENGFKCHTMSEGHQRQLLLFADNPHKFLDNYSSEFKSGYVELLRRRFGTKRVHANQVYQEYISDKDHLHMNATKWLTLTEFVKWLGREGICVVDETEKGWFVTYIDRDPETIARQQQLAKKEKMDKDDEERMLEFIEKQVERAAKDEKDNGPKFTELVRDNEEEKVQLQLGSKKPSTSKPVTAGSTNVFKTERKDWDTASVRSSKSSSSSMSEGGKRKLSTLEQIKVEQERMKQKKFRKDYWLTEGIVVKIITKRLGDKYYKEKGVVIEVIDKYVGVIKMLETGHKLKLDQEHLETVIPSPGREIRILNGEYRGNTAILQSVDMDKYSVTLRINSGEFEGTTLRGIPYEEVSKRIFVTVGTTSFHQLIEVVLSDEAVSKFRKWGAKEVRIQGGKYSTDRDNTHWIKNGINFQLYDYKRSITDDLRWADLIICHAGAGTTIEALDLGKIIIVVPNETLMDNHQMELADKLGQENYAFQATVDTLVERLSEIKVNEIIPFPPARPQLLDEYLTNVVFSNGLAAKQK